MSRIIFLNGCGSAGKSSIAKAIQTLSKTPWLHVGIDTFINMLPEKFWGNGEHAKEGYFSFSCSENTLGKYVQVKTETIGEEFFNNHIPRVVSMLADLGHDIIVDEVILDKVGLDRYLEAFRNHEVHLVHVMCDFNVLIERERLRGDRLIGLANDQFERLQLYTYDYDMLIDTTHISPMENAQRILTAIK